MADRKDLRVGDDVKHRFRENKYQQCTVLKVEEGCNGLVKVLCEDGFYGGREESIFPPQDLTKIAKAKIIDRTETTKDGVETVRCGDTLQVLGKSFIQDGVRYFISSSISKIKI